MEKHALIVIEINKNPILIKKIEFEKCLIFPLSSSNKYITKTFLLYHLHILTLFHLHPQPSMNRNDCIILNIIAFSCVAVGFGIYATIQYAYRNKSMEQSKNNKNDEKFVTSPTSSSSGLCTKPENNKNDVEFVTSPTLFSSDLCIYGLCTNTRDNCDKLCFRCTEQWKRNECQVPIHLEELRKRCQPCPICEKQGGPIEICGGMCIYCHREDVYGAHQPFIKVGKFGWRSYLELGKMFHEQSPGISDFHTKFNRLIHDEVELTKSMERWFLGKSDQILSCGDIRSFGEHVRRALRIFYSNGERELAPLEFNCPPCLGNKHDNIGTFNFSPERARFFRTVSFSTCRVHYILSDNSQTLYCDWLVTQFINDKQYGHFPITVSFKSEEIMAKNQKSCETSISTIFARALYSATFAQQTPITMSFEVFVETYKFVSSLDLIGFLGLISSTWDVRGPIVVIIDCIDNFFDKLSEGDALRFGRTIHFGEGNYKFIFSGSSKFFLGTGSTRGSRGGKLILN